MSDFGRTHRESPLTWHRARRSRSRGLHAGDRIPDVTVLATACAGTEPPAVRSAAGQPVRLHRLLPYDRWTLLLDADRVDAQTLHSLREAWAGGRAPGEAVLVSPDGTEVSRALGRADEYKLVRPDRTVAVIAPLDRPDLLSDYVRTFLTP
jgi:hypothetical protein